jgi:DNA-binding MarR family transcriptional regulator
MPKFMKMLNNISRSQAIYRQRRVTANDIHSGHYAFVLAICTSPGRSQEEIARELCLNKSTVARNLGFLEEKGYITRSPIPSDKRRFSVYPTERMMDILPQVKGASEEWMSLLSDEIPEAELEIFNSVLERMQTKARELVSEEDKK